MFTETQLASYRQTKRERHAKQLRLLKARQQLAWRIAKEAALLLRQSFGVTKVSVFGSLVQADLFHRRSDIDLAVWGLDERVYYRAVGQLQALEPTLSIDLVRIEEARPTLVAVVEKEGQVL